MADINQLFQKFASGQLNERQMSAFQILVDGGHEKLSPSNAKQYAEFKRALAADNAQMGQPNQASAPTPEEQSNYQDVESMRQAEAQTQAGDPNALEGLFRPPQSLDPEAVRTEQAKSGALVPQTPVKQPTIQGRPYDPTPKYIPKQILDKYNADMLPLNQALAVEKLMLEEGYAIPPGYKTQKGEDFVLRNERQRIKKAEDWYKMPEISEGLQAQALSIPLLYSGKEETAKILKKNFPYLKIEADDKGAFLIKDSKSGKEYAWKKGLQASDVQRGIGAAIPFIMFGGGGSLASTVAGTAAVGAGIEASQKAVGGDFDPEQIAVDVGLGTLGYGVAKGVGGAISRVKASRAEKAVTKAREAKWGKDWQKVESKYGAPKPRLATKMEPPAPREKIAVPAQEGDSVLDFNLRIEQNISKAKEGLKDIGEKLIRDKEKSGRETVSLAQALRFLSEGRGSEKAIEAAKQRVAKSYAQDPKVLEAAKRQGLAADLNPEVLSKDPALRDVLGALGNLPDNAVSDGFRRSVEKTNARAVAFINRLKQSETLSNLAESIEKGLKKSREDIAKVESKAYDDFAGYVADYGIKNQKTKVPRFQMKELEKHLSNRLEQVLGQKPTKAQLYGTQKIDPKALKFLEKQERQILDFLSIKKDGKMSYNALAQIRKNINAQLRGESTVYGDSTRTLLKGVKKVIDSQESAIAREVGGEAAEETFKLALAQGVLRGRVQNQLTELIGKKHAGDMFKTLRGKATKAVEGTAVKDYARLMKAVPKEYRQDLAAQTLEQLIYKNAADETGRIISSANIAKTEALLRKNPTVRNIIFAQLPKGAWKEFQDYALIHRQFSDVMKRHIKTGYSRTALKVIEGEYDNIAKTLTEYAKTGTLAMASEAATGFTGIASVVSIGGRLLRRKKKDATQAVAELLMDPQVRNSFSKKLIQGDKEGAIQGLIKTSKFKQFIRDFRGIRKGPVRGKVSVDIPATDMRSFYRVLIGAAQSARPKTQEKVTEEIEKAQNDE